MPTVARKDGSVAKTDIPANRIKPQKAEKAAEKAAFSRVSRLCSNVYFIVGMENSAPCRIPDGQREVTVFVRV